MPKRRRATGLGRLLHRVAYRLSAGRIGHHLSDGSDVLLLMSTDMAGRTHTTPVRYVRDCESWLVPPVDRGDAAPDWLREVEVGHDVVVQVGPKRFAATAVVVDGQARDALWWTVTRRYPDLAPKGGDRPEPPVVVLRARSRDTADVPQGDLLLGS